MLMGTTSWIPSMGIAESVQLRCLRRASPGWSRNFGCGRTRGDPGSIVGGWELQRPITHARRLLPASSRIDTNWAPGASSVARKALEEPHLFKWEGVGVGRPSLKPSGGYQQASTRMSFFGLAIEFA